ncbi:unnamed protein product, partial [Choristocarpus tenellus]
NCFESTFRLGDVVFLNCTCFDGNVMEKLTRRAEALKEGALVITTSFALLSKEFKTVDQVSR